ncbi:TetR/AcrR family transcriptional regulator [Verrucosispora sp. WMMA2044]|uniref:TetR/AcrR family transcriptional regulator n=1 Tax=Verrucosispora sioxanthis TaxID=2499994 RepID=A0A6M1LC57_9ACTN|nr:MULTISPECIES: TetR/AcrR family transcriptional regulator [Micromonospora]NEE66692.1 TetR/AcrR family transcriptional regulator [Verrucosispora sioxanthis]NGM15802.1 TetR/AcrR family transcriptional regulator [Verrucosispora sioxanthis]WBB48575.1 TetR/AcrR family transcriptional regulator [Verrucosispora sp. WMMA2044]
MLNRHPDKRSRLVDAAVRLVHEQGFARTTLADIAGAAGVPLGNVYYYFKTKEAIGEALVAHHAGHYATLRGQWNQSGDARSRLAAFVQMTADNRAVLARSGCPVGTLCAELHKAGGPLAEQTGAIFTELLGWLEEQFRALGRDTDAADLALHLLSALQGVSLIAHSLDDPEYVDRETARLTGWIQTL